MKNLPHLLCVDDDNKIRELLKIYLVGKNFRVSIAKDSFDAEKLTEFFMFDLIILDIMMPKRNGIEFLDLLRKFDLNTPVLMLTADSQLDKKKSSYSSRHASTPEEEKGAEEIVTKNENKIREAIKTEESKRN